MWCTGAAKEMCSETDLKNLSNLVSVADASIAVPRNEIRGGGEEVMKREMKKEGETGRKDVLYEHPNMKSRASDCRDGV